MEDSQSAPATGRTNWRRFAVAVGVPTAVAAGLVVALQTGALAANFVISGTQFKLSADTLEGNGFTQYSDALVDGSGKPRAAAMSGISSATITNLCQSVSQKTPLGTITLQIKAATGVKASDDDSKKVQASNLLIGMSELSGDATFTNIEIGRDAGNLNRAGDAKGAVGGFGQQAEHVTINSLKQQAYSTSASTFKLTGMSLKLLTGDGNECY
ncbi:cholesterol esterase [Actinoplanes sp. SE50]|uniref:DUF6230 family protein n=1 Tax=unclassified Actinoplanes TaxID=2626549 RepID=UPI00023ED222|nr:MULTISPECIES: DUF6230 family protein [unclassified Actinoplanes]AEV83891.1 putative cholesterol esterase [Actinoplanes sp. SE50/110]ATO81965.1 cholesterol esterase [Actinoplanes sp. SE50]SLL99373.1 cholesterol esterase [Actinoplanes sp. SE50/110]